MKLGVSSKDSLLFEMILVSNLILGCAWQKKKKKKKKIYSKKCNRAENTALFSSHVSKVC